MPYDLNSPAALKKAGWKVKIRDAEAREEPHVTIMRKYHVWRVSLRDCSFLDKGHGWKQIEEGVRSAVEAACEELRVAWDARYPENPISSVDDDADD